MDQPLTRKKEKKGEIPPAYLSGLEKKMHRFQLTASTQYLKASNNFLVFFPFDKPFPTYTSQEKLLTFLDLD